MAVRGGGQRARQPPPQGGAPRRVRGRPVDRRSRGALRRRPRARARVRAARARSDREAICLVAWEGLSIADAARAAGCSTATFHVRLSRARARLARLLETPTNLETSHGPLIERVRAADPVSPDEFAGLANFDALVLEPPRRRRKWLALPAVGAVIAALVVVPDGRAGGERGRCSARSRRWPCRRTRSSTPSRTPATTTNDYGERQVWVYGGKQMRWLQADSEEVYAEGKGTTRWSKGKIEHHPDVLDGPQRDLPRRRAAAGGEVGQGHRA